MKHLFTMTAIAAALIVSSIARAQVAPTYETVYDIKQKGYVLVSTPFETFSDVFKKGFDIPVQAFTGTTLSADAIPVFGLKATYSTKILGTKSGRKLMGSISAAWLNVQGEKGRFTLFGGITF